MGRLLRLALLIGWMAWGWPSAPLAAQSDPLEVTFLDVGQGDAVLVRTPEGRTMLVDAGPPGADIVGMLRARGVEQLDLVVASHPHADHIGGMRAVVESMPVVNYMDNGEPHTTETYLEVMRAVQARSDIRYLQAEARTLTLGSVTIDVLPPPGIPGYSLNDNSVGLLVEHGDFRALLTGDSESPELEHWLISGVVRDVTLFKAPHHGSSDALSNGFLAVARPKVIVISVGQDNLYGHPHWLPLNVYQGGAETVLRTDQDGSVTVLGHADGTYRIDQDAAPLMGVPGGEPTVTLGSPRREAPLPEAMRGIELSVFADAPGNDHDNRNGEYVVVHNGTEVVLRMARWTLCDAAQHCYRFPDDVALSPGERLTLYTGDGLDHSPSLFWGSSQAVWNNDGDVAVLYDFDRREVARLEY